MLPDSRRFSGRILQSKSADFGGAFIPLAGKLFSVTEIVSGNGKHSLLFALCKYVGFSAVVFSRHGRVVRARLCSFGLSKTFRPLVGRIIEPAAVKTGKAASIHVGIVTAAKIPTDSIHCIIVDCATWSHFDATSDTWSKQAHVGWSYDD